MEWPSVPGPQPVSSPEEPSHAGIVLRQAGRTRHAGGIGSRGLEERVPAVWPAYQEDPMTIGGSIAVIAIGAILTFAVTVQFAGLNIDAVGIILMAAGAVGLVFGIIRFFSYRRRDPGPL
jgi:hypothetical protein